MTSEATPERPAPDEAALAEIETVALALAREAGSEITAALSRVVTVEYKTKARRNSEPTDPVSEVDNAIEAMLRERLGARFPDHAVVGEEMDIQPSADAEFVWAVDPVDGTTNFINGFPLFSCSIGVLHRGRPVAGAIWCSTSHALRSGIYHAHRGGALRFDEQLLDTESRNQGVRRRLAGAPGGSPGGTRTWDHRVTGSAAIEAAFTAAGIFNSSYFRSLAIWDVAAGVALVQAAGGEAWLRDGSGWRPFERFEAPSKVRAKREPSLRDWRMPLLLGEPDAVAARRGLIRQPSALSRLVRKVGGGR